MAGRTLNGYKFRYGTLNFRPRITYETLSSSNSVNFQSRSGNINPSTLRTELIYERPYGPGNVLVNPIQSAILESNGQWRPLRENEARYVNTDGSLGSVVNPNSTNFVLGTGAINSLTSRTPNNLSQVARLKSIETLQRGGGLTQAQAYQAYNISQNTTPSGTQSTPVLYTIPAQPAPQGGPAPTPTPTPAVTPPPAPQLPTPGSSSDLDANPTASLPIAGSFTGGLRYPEDIGTTGQDRIKFQACALTNRFGERQLETTATGGLLFKFPEPKPQPISGEEVFIGIQAPISDQNSVEWGSDSLNALQSAAFSVSLGSMKDTYDQNSVNSALTNLSKTILDEATNYKDRIRKLLAGEAASINNILARTDNVVLNNNLELLFNGPQLRPFNFQFKMSARGQSEALIIKRIIKFFKYHMAVRKEEGLFLKAPHVFNIEYQYGRNNVLHEGINRIKTCALTNFSVDYTPLGTYMTYDDGTMVSYNLSMQFQELIPIYDDNYNDSHQIGY